MRRCSRGVDKELLVRRSSQGGACEEMLTRCLRRDAHKEVLVRRCSQGDVVLCSGMCGDREGTVAVLFNEWIDSG